MSCTCSACRETVTPIGPSIGARLAFWAGLGTTLLGLVLCPFLGLGFFALSPVIIAFGLAIGPLAEDAFAPPLCPSCSRRFVALEEASVQDASVRGERPAPIAMPSRARA